MPSAPFWRYPHRHLAYSSVYRAIRSVPRHRLANGRSQAFGNFREIHISAKNRFAFHKIKLSTHISCHNYLCTGSVLDHNHLLIYRSVTLTLMFLSNDWSCLRSHIAFAVHGFRSPAPHDVRTAVPHCTSGCVLCATSKWRCSQPRLATTITTVFDEKWKEKKKNWEKTTNKICMRRSTSNAWKLVVFAT